MAAQNSILSLWTTLKSSRRWVGRCFRLKLNQITSLQTLHYVPTRRDVGRSILLRNSYYLQLRIKILQIPHSYELFWEIWIFYGNLLFILNHKASITFPSSAKSVQLLPIKSTLCSLTSLVTSNSLFHNIKLNKHDLGIILSLVGSTHRSWWWANT